MLKLILHTNVLIRLINEKEKQQVIGICTIVKVIGNGIKALPLYYNTKKTKVAINKEERRFLRYWEEQRKGSKVGYYAMYIGIWFFTAALCLFFVGNNFVTFGKTSINVLYLILALSLIIAASFTHYTYRRNEKRFKKIINREVDLAQD